MACRNIYTTGHYQTKRTKSQTGGKSTFSFISFIELCLDGYIKSWMYSLPKHKTNTV